MNKGPLRFAKGTIRVIPEGYWHTSGGDKGSFGYFPHLKDESGRPVYPDTQVMGDLKMAADWFIQLAPSKYSHSLIQGIFGAKGGNSPGYLFSSDLELDQASKAQWDRDRERDKNRFQVKPRTSIEDESRTNESQMLVNLEMAYLKELALTADIYLYGPFTEEESDSAKRLLSEACRLLSGFGAFRSRGYSRGKVDLEWETEKAIETPAAPDTEKMKAERTYTYALTAQVNFRNKQIEPGTDQLLVSRPFITSEQVRAWFIKAYHASSGDWPTPDQIRSLIFTPLYPSLIENSEDILCGFPSAMTTLRNEKGQVKDIAGRTVIKKDDKEGDVGEFFNTKTKPLISGTYVTDERRPKTILAELSKRIRNSIDGNFVTLKSGGLFVQEYIRRGTTFAGTVAISGTDYTFINKAHAILKEVRPVINGCIFTPFFVDSVSAREKDGRFALVTAPISFSSDEGLINFDSCDYRENAPGSKNSRIELENANQIIMDTHRRYNTTLNRPRRPRIVIAPGSVLCGSVVPDEVKERQEAVLFWKGFGEDFVREDISAGNGVEKGDEAVQDGGIEGLVRGLIDNEKMTRAQAGFLREFLHTARDLKAMEDIARDRKEKFEKKNKHHYADLYGKIEAYLKNQKRDEMKRFINSLLDRLYEEWWRKGAGRQ